MRSAKSFTPETIELGSLAVVVSAIIALYWALMRTGFPTGGDDWAIYIQDALNLLHGDHYSATGYIFNPALDIGPTAYPPLFPLTLVLPIALWGIDFGAIRDFQLIFWAGFLVFVGCIARRRLRIGASLVVVALVGLSPYIFMFREAIASESLFLALLYGLFVFAARLEERAQPDGEIAPRDGVWLGLIVALCVATRSVGLILLPTLLAYDLLRVRRLRRATVLACGIAGFCFVSQMILIDFLHDYMAALYHNSIVDVRTAEISSVNIGGTGRLAQVMEIGAHRVVAFATELTRFWAQGNDGAWLPRVMALGFGILAMPGMVVAVRSRLLHCDVFAVLYTGSLLVLPPVMSGARMQLPLLPLFYTYVLCAATASRMRRIRMLGMAAVLLSCAAAYAQSYRDLDIRGPLDGFQSADYADMFDFIRRNTPSGSAIMFDKPRTLALYTQRRSAAIYNVLKGDQLLSYMHAIDARYILLYDPWCHSLPRQQCMADLAGDHADEFAPMHDAGPFALYELRP